MSTNDLDGLNGETVKPEREPIPVFEETPTKRPKPKYFVAGSTFFAQMSDWELKVPVKLSARTVKTLRDTVGDEDEFDQLVRLFGILGDETTVERLLDEDFIDATEAAIAFFQAWQEKNEARLGELSRSSI